MRPGLASSAQWWWQFALPPKCLDAWLTPGNSTADVDGWARARVPVESAAHALADFLRLGADLEILEPAELRDQAARTIRAMAAIYD